jgi:hypothetical protein
LQICQESPRISSDHRLAANAIESLHFSTLDSERRSVPRRVCLWHEAADRECPCIGRCRVISGHEVLKSSLSGFDPERTCGPVQWSASEASFTPYQNTGLSRYDAAS